MGVLQLNVATPLAKPLGCMIQPFAKTRRSRTRSVWKLGLLSLRNSKDSMPVSYSVRYFKRLRLLLLPSDGPPTNKRPYSSIFPPFMWANFAVIKPTRLVWSRSASPAWYVCQPQACRYDIKNKALASQQASIHRTFFQEGFTKPGIFQKADQHVGIPLSLHMKPSINGKIDWHTQIWPCQLCLAKKIVKNYSWIKNNKEIQDTWSDMLFHFNS